MTGDPRTILNEIEKALARRGITLKSIQPDYNPLADEDSIVVNVRAAAQAFNAAGARLLLANRLQWADRELDYIRAWFDLEGAMQPFLESQGSRPPPITDPPKRAV